MADSIPFFQMFPRLTLSPLLRGQLLQAKVTGGRIDLGAGSISLRLHMRDALSGEERQAVLDSIRSAYGFRRAELEPSRESISARRVVAVTDRENAGSGGNAAVKASGRPEGGTADGSTARQAMLYVGNHDGSKEGASMLIGSSNNDSFIGGAGDEIITGTGRNDVRFRNTNDGGATLDQTNTGNRTTANNISGYDPLLNFIRVNESDLANITARFIDGALVVRNGRTTNTFLTDNNQSAQLPADINDVLDIDLGEILAEDIVLGNGELSLDSRERHFDNAIVNTSINRKK